LNIKAKSYSEYAGVERKINKPILDKNESKGITKCKHACTKGRSQDPDKSTRNITGSIQKARDSLCVPETPIFLSPSQNFNPRSRTKAQAKIN